jgi:hypothetical protein
MKSDTPRTDEWETYCDECYYHLWRVRRKNERGFNDGFHVQNGEGARQLVELLNKQDDELIAARELVKNLEITVLSLMMENKTVTEQRDRLADLVKQFVSILDITEESDSGRLFHPTNITSCRAGDLQKIGELVEALKRASRTTNPNEL